MERWLPIVGYEGLYEVSNLGNVRSVDRYIEQAHRNGSIYRRMMRGKPMRARLHLRGKAGRWAVNLCRDGKHKYQYVHTAVCTAFNGPRPEGMVCRHLDGDRDNNTPANLAWGTPKENYADMVRHGNAHWMTITHCPRGHDYRLTGVMNGQGYRIYVEFASRRMLAVTIYAVRQKGCLYDPNPTYNQELRTVHSRKALVEATPLYRLEGC